MKKLIFILAIPVVILSGCSGNQTKSNTNTHVHEDGSVHKDHDTSKHHQEEFIVGDSSTHKHEQQNHDSHDHKHEH